MSQDSTPSTLCHCPDLERPRAPLRRTIPGTSALLILAVVVACGDGQDQVMVTTPALEPSGPALPSEPALGETPDDPDAPGPLYAIMYEVYDDVGSTSYLSLLDTLDIEAVDTSSAREYGGGRAFIQTFNGWLFVGDAESPTVTRYSIGAGDELIPEGELSFAAYGFQTSNFDSWNVTFISPEKAYEMDFAGGTTIIWNPTTMEIIGEIPAPDELYREGLSLEGTPGVVRDGLLYRTFDWVNYDDATYSTDFLLGVYDVQTDQLVSLQTETRCPVPGNLVDVDEAGNIYFSNWIWPVAGTLMRGAPASCVLRINAGDTGFDPTWSLNYADVTGGRQGAMFAYLQDGQGLISVFDDDRTSFAPTTDPWAYVGSNNWRIWNVDINGGSGAPLNGIDYNGGAFTPVQFDGRLFLMVPGGEEVNYATQLYEVSDGRATPYVKLPGWSYQFRQLR